MPLPPCVIHHQLPVPNHGPGMAERQDALRLACPIGEKGEQILGGLLSSKLLNSVVARKSLNPRQSMPNLTAPHADACLGDVD